MNQQPIYVFAKWQVKEEHLEEVLSLLPQLAAASASEEGNLFYQVHQSLSDTHTLMLAEGYRDEAALENHRSAAHFKQLVINQIVPLLEKREVVIAHRILPID